MTKEMILAYVGTLAPDTPEYNQPPFSRSANTFQDGLLRGLESAGLNVDLILSIRAIESVPRGNRFWVPGHVVGDAGGRRIQFLGFINVTPIKQLMIGIRASLALIAWALKRRRDARIIHIHNLTLPNGILMWVVARITGSKISASLCDVDIPGDTVPDTLPFRLDYRMARWVTPRLDGRVVVSGSIASELAPGCSSILIEGGVDEPMAREMVVGEINRDTSDNCFRMVAVGRLDEINGFDLILDCMASSSDPTLILDIAGAGPLASRIISEANRDPRIRFHGYLDLDRVFRLYAESDLILVARKTQDLNTRFFFPGKFMEALLSGVPVLATCFGHVASKFQGHFYPCVDETGEGLLKTISHIRGQSAQSRQAVGESARSYVLENYRWENQGRKVLDYFRRIAAPMQTQAHKEAEDESNKS